SSTPTSRDRPMSGHKRALRELFVASVLACLATSPLPARAMTQDPAVRTGDWSLYEDGPAHNGVNRAERTLSPTTVRGLHVVHTYPNWTEDSVVIPYQLVVGSFG